MDETKCDHPEWSAPFGLVTTSGREMGSLNVQGCMACGVLRTLEKLQEDEGYDQEVGG